MEGVILFADDKVHKFSYSEEGIDRSAENALFTSLCTEFPVLGVNSLELAKTTISSIGTFSAIILDWQFYDDRSALLENGDEDDTTKLVAPPSTKETATLEFLEENDFYSLIYIYSEKDVEAEYGERLRNKFGNRIKIERKNNIENTEEAKAQILKDLQDWKNANRHLSIPLLWSATLSKATQLIFKELSEADPNWLKEVYDSAKLDGGNPSIFVIEIFQSLLSESIVKNKELIDAIRDFAVSEVELEDGVLLDKEISIAKLFNRLFYSTIDEGTPIMTGDICEIGDDKLGIIITPECDIKDVCEDSSRKFDLLVFEKNSFDVYLQKHKSYQKAEFEVLLNGSGKQQGRLETIKKLFNLEDSKFHILPSFPMDDTHNNSISINFSIDCKKIRSKVVQKLRRKYKLNAPFLQQLRQRYISHLGRVGVPTLPDTLRNFNLK